MVVRRPSGLGSRSNFLLPLSGSEFHDAVLWIFVVVVVVVVVVVMVLNGKKKVQKEKGYENKEL